MDWIRLADAEGIKPLHKGVKQLVGGKTDSGWRSRSGGDTAPSGTDGEHGQPLTAPWARAVETGRMGQASLSQCGLGPVSNGAQPN
jgi:hypothetical protein